MKKLRKVLSILMIVSLMAVTACQSGGGNTSAPAPSDDGESKGDTKSDYKIAIMTATVTQGDEVFTTAQRLAQEKGNIIHFTMPDNISSELETMISTALSVVEDESVKAMILPGVEGSVAMMNRIKQVRPDMFFWANSPQEDSSVIASTADVCFNANLPETGKQMAKAAKDMGAKRIFHLSFPRHMSQQILLERHDIMKKTAEELGLEFIDITTPDPTSDVGVTGTQQFVLENVARLIDEHGNDSAFFGTNPSQLEPMIKVIVDKKAIFLMPQDPTPFTGYPSALGIKITPEMKGDYNYAHDQIREILASKGMTGRAGNWSIPLPAVAYGAGYQYACDYIEGKTNGKFDKAHIEKIVKELAGSDSTVSEYLDTSTNQTLNNYLLITNEYMTY